MIYNAKCRESARKSKKIKKYLYLIQSEKENNI